MTEKSGERECACKRDSMQAREYMPSPKWLRAGRGERGERRERKGRE